MFNGRSNVTYMREWPITSWYNILRSGITTLTSKGLVWVNQPLLCIQAKSCCDLSCDHIRYYSDHCWFSIMMITIKGKDHPAIWSCPLFRPATTYHCGFSYCIISCQQEHGVKRSDKLFKWLKKKDHKLMWQERVQEGMK